MKLSHIALLSLLLPLFSLSSCRDTDKFDIEVPAVTPQEQQPDTPDNPGTAASGYDEQFRPQFHYTPAKNWVNDPNGLVYADGVWHFHYQYNPSGRGWGNLSWGHATSTDLIHWQEQPVALQPDELGMIFSGCAVIDRDNTAGFGTGAAVALYTSSGDHQQQSLAYSTDGLKTLTKYAANPVIANTDMPDFRDPNVFYHAESGRWIMALAKGWSYSVEFWASADLKQWQRLSEFKTPVARCNVSQWECPCLMRMSYGGAEKWVLLVSVNPGGPNGGSATMYFTGSFDGTSFTADDRSDYPLWMDYGTDNYASVAWSDAPDNRHTVIGWMNSWNYAEAVPSAPYCSAFTLPRDLSLIDFEGRPVLASNVVAEIEGIAGDWAEISPAGADFPASVSDVSAAGGYEVEVTIPAGQNAEISLSNAAGERADYAYNASTRRLSLARNAQTGAVAFNGAFSLPGVSAPVLCSDSELTLRFFVDRSSVEAFTSTGSMALTALVFPSSVYSHACCPSATRLRVRPLSRIWP